MQAPQPTEPRVGLGTRLWLLRHAEVHADWQGKAYGDLDVPLSPAGLERTQEMIADFARLEPARILASPLQRARLLGEGLAQASGAPLTIRDNLREIHRGTWQGLRVAELYADQPQAVQDFYADPWTWRGHGGESDEMVWARAWPEVLEACAGGDADVVFATHYNIVRVITAAAMAIPADCSFALRVDPGRAVLLVDEPGGWSLHGSNLHAPGERTP